MMNYFKQPIIDKNNIINSILTDIDISYINFIFHDLFLEILNNNIENLEALNKAITLNLQDFEPKKADFIAKKILIILPQIFADFHEIKNPKKYINYLNIIGNYLDYLNKFYGKNYLVNNFLVNLNYQHLEYLYSISSTARDEEIAIIEKILNQIINLASSNNSFLVTHNQNRDVNCKLEFEKLSIFFLKITDNFQSFYCQNISPTILLDYLNKIIVNNSSSSIINNDLVKNIITSFIGQNGNIILKDFDFERIVTLISLINCFVDHDIAQSFYLKNKGLILQKIKSLDALIANDFEHDSVAKQLDSNNLKLEYIDFKLSLNKQNYDNNSAINYSNFIIKKPENYNFYFNLFRQFDYIKNFMGIDFICQNIVMSNYKSSESINLLVNYIKFLNKKNLVTNLKLHNIFQVEMSFVYSCLNTKKNYLILINVDEISADEKTLFYSRNQENNNRLIEKIITNYGAQTPVIYCNLDLTLHFIERQKLKKIIIEGGANPSKQRLEIVSNKLQEIFDDLINDYIAKNANQDKNARILNNDIIDYALEKVVSVRIYDGSVSRRLS